MYSVASHHHIFSFLFSSGLDHKWSRDKDILFLTLQEKLLLFPRLPKFGSLW